MGRKTQGFKGKESAVPLLPLLSYTNAYTINVGRYNLIFIIIANVFHLFISFIAGVCLISSAIHSSSHISLKW